MNRLFIISFFCLIASQLHPQPGFWQPVTKDYEKGVHGTSISIIHTLPSGGVFVVTEQGLFRSIDNGNSWIKCTDGLPKFNRLRASTITSIAHAVDQTIWISTWENGIYNSTNNGETWNQIAFPDSYVESIVIDSLNTIFATRTTQGNLVRSNDLGKTWEIIFGEEVIQGPIFIGPQNTLFSVGTNAATGYCSLSRSDDFGYSWTYIQIYYLCISCLSYLPDNTIFIGTTKPAMLDHGSHRTGIFKSSKMGQEWLPITPHKDIYVSVMALNSIGHIYYSYRSDNFIRRTTDEGITWEDVGDKFDNLLISSIAFDKDDYLFVGTERGGLFRSEYKTTKVETRSNQTEIKNNTYLYPNPANNNFTLNFTIKNADQVTAKIYNPIGQEIAIIIDKYYYAGAHQLNFQTNDIATGVYIVQLKIGSLISNHKLAIIK